MELKLIKQVHDTGCGIACVAMLKDQSYETVRAELRLIKEKMGEDPEELRTHAEHLMPLFQGFEYAPEPVEFEFADSIQGAAILAVAENGKKINSKDYHWVVAFRINGCLWIADPALGELYRYENWKGKTLNDYRLAVEAKPHSKGQSRTSLSFPTLQITSVVPG